MACEEWGTRLTDWALDELSPLEVQQLEQHLQQCAECGQAATRLRGLRQALVSSLTDCQMPAHLLLTAEKPQSVFAGFRAAFLRTAALSAAAAAVFLAVVSAGFHFGGSRLFPSTPKTEASLPRAELETYVSQAVTQEASRQREEFGVAKKELAISLRQEQMENLMRIAQQVHYLEQAQNAVWKETQRQNEVINLVALNRMQQAESRPK